MNKKLLGILAAMMSVVLLMSGCATLLLPGTTSDTASAGATASEDTSTIIVAEVNGVAIYKDAYEEMYTQLLYNAYYNGEDIESDEVLSIIRQEALDQLITNEVIDQKFIELGYDVLTDEQLAEAEEDMMDYLVSAVESYYLDEVLAGLDEDYTDEELREAEEAYAETFFEGADVTREEYLQNFTYPIMYENAYEAEVGDVEPVEQEIKDQYNEYVAADQETIASSAVTYVTRVNNGETVYYIPEGVRRVRQVLISMDEEMAGAISVLRNSDYQDAADILQAEGLAAIEEQANEAIGKLNDGTTFDDLIAEYNPDADMPEEGYAVMEGATDNPEAYVAAALELAAIGDYTALVGTDDGYYILEYYADEPAGPISYEKVREAIADEIRITLQDEAWDEVIDQWKSEATIQTYEGNL